jgi:type 1 glutamine amidotransferase
MLKTSSFALAALPFGACALQNTAVAPPPAARRPRLLFFTKSQNFGHDAVTRQPDAAGHPGPKLAWGEQYMKDWVEAAGYDIVITKEGNYFTPENLAPIDAFVFYTCGKLTDPPAAPARSNPADQTSVLTVAGETAFLDAIKDGKGFLGLHCAGDTLHPNRNGRPTVIAPADTKAAGMDPYSVMLGAEFTAHASQQEALIRIGSKTFPGLNDLAEFKMTEEWYGFTNLSPDLHVILVQDTSTMKLVNGQREGPYRGPAYPETWARMHGKGRVFYSSMGHRKDVWEAPLYKKMILASLAWITGQTNADIPPNLKETCPALARA